MIVPQAARQDNCVVDLDGMTDTILARCEELASCSDEPGRLTRTFLRPAMRQAQALLSQWMQKAGLTVRTDAVGNVIGRKAGNQQTIFAIGSHFDTVPNAGKFDGVLGILIGIAAAELLQSCRFRHSLDVLAFSEEEGVRFRAAYLGSHAVCGSFDSKLLLRVDADGISMVRAIHDFELDPELIPNAAYPHGELIGYFEVHIEQGPVLEQLDRSLGVVSAIIGQLRFRLRFVGCAGHAGTLPMEMRHDALAAAAHFVCEVERIAQQFAGLRATVGSLIVSPGVENVVPGEVKLGLDVRHEFDQIRNQVVEQVFTRSHKMCQKRGISLDIEPLMESVSVACDAGLVARLSESIHAGNYSAHTMVSGAGHDAVIMASRCPVAMLFVRSPGGMSHHPDESVRREDVRAALDVAVRFLRKELTEE